MFLAGAVNACDGWIPLLYVVRRLISYDLLAWQATYFNFQTVMYWKTLAYKYNIGFEVIAFCTVLCGRKC